MEVVVTVQSDPLVYVRPENFATNFHDENDSILANPAVKQTHLSLSEIFMDTWMRR